MRKRCLSCLVESVEPRHGGDISTIYEIRCSQPDQRVILKVYPDTFHWKMAKEVYVYRLLDRAEGLPTPSILWSDDSKALLPQHYVLMTMLKGQPLSHVASSLSARVGDSWPLFVWPLAFACAAINLKQWRQEAPHARWPQMGPGFMAFAIASGVAFVATAHVYYIAGSANYLGKNDPIGKEAGFANVVAAAERKRKEAGGRWFVTSDYRMYSMLRWHLRDAVPVVQINERARYIGFRHPVLDGPVGLYVAPKDNARAAVWNGTGATLQPAGQADLAWRGYSYDVYAFQKVTGWNPVFSPIPRDSLYEARPN